MKREETRAETKARQQAKLLAEAEKKALLKEQLQSDVARKNALAESAFSGGFISHQLLNVPVFGIDF